MCISTAQWNSSKPIIISFDIIPKEFHSYFKQKGVLILAQVNLDAKNTDDLIIQNFEFPDPDIVSHLLIDY